jgi:hypothetical protein
MIADRRTNLMADLDAFYTEHRCCGDLAGGDGRRPGVAGLRLRGCNRSSG